MMWVNNKVNMELITYFLVVNQWAINANTTNDTAENLKNQKNLSIHLVKLN